MEPSKGFEPLTFRIAAARPIAITTSSKRMASSVHVRPVRPRYCTFLLYSLPRLSSSADLVYLQRAFVYIH